MNEMEENFGKNFIAVCIVTLLHFLVFTFLQVKGLHFYTVILFVIVYIAPTAVGTIFSTIFLPKVYLVVISQLLFITIVYGFQIYMNNNYISFLGGIFEWYAIINILSVIIVVCIKSVYKLILKIRAH